MIFVASDLDPSREHQHAPGPSLWPVGFAVGVVVLLVGFVVSWAIVAIGVFITVFFAFLWLRGLTRGSHLAEKPEKAEPERRRAASAAVPRAAREDQEVERYPRNVFLEASTLGLGAVIGGLVTIPPLGMLAASGFEGAKFQPVDLGPLSGYPEGQFIITTFVEDPNAGEVSRRTAYIRYNGLLVNQPSFTILSNRCAHLGCPVQPNGPVAANQSTTETNKQGQEVLKKTPTKPAGFGCPCHGGQYDTEGNRVSGPPVRALDRYSFKIVNGHLILITTFSVNKVDGEGKDAIIHKTTLTGPGEHVDGPGQILYPLQPPH